MQVRYKFFIEQLPCYQLHLKANIKSIFHYPCKLVLLV